MTALLSIRDLKVTYRRDGVAVPALKSVSLEVFAGERLAIIGESGSGKSTLALAIAGLLAGGAEIGGRMDWFLPAGAGAKAKDRQPSALATRHPRLDPDVGFLLP
ncbi:ATP-binding cassette domain-containing protein, partial [Mesorhizobium sp. M00.F.Ca.ET.149.01.1.1]